MNEFMTAAAGRRVIAADTAEELGAVKSYGVDVSGRRIDRLHISGGRRHAEFVDWADVASFGSDAVMVSSAEAVHEAGDDRDVAIVRGSVRVLGARVLDSDGFERGNVTEVQFDTRTGAIVRVQAERAEFDGDQVRSWGSYAVVVGADQPG